MAAAPSSSIQQSGDATAAERIALEMPPDLESSDDDEILLHRGKASDNKKRPKLLNTVQPKEGTSAAPNPPPLPISLQSPLNHGERVSTTPVSRTRISLAKLVNPGSGRASPVFFVASGVGPASTTGPAPPPTSPFAPVPAQLGQERPRDGEPRNSKRPREGEQPTQSDSPVPIAEGGGGGGVGGGSHTEDSQPPLTATSGTPSASASGNGHQFGFPHSPLQQAAQNAAPLQQHGQSHHTPTVAMSTPTPVTTISSSAYSAAHREEPSYAPTPIQQPTLCVMKLPPLGKLEPYPLSPEETVEEKFSYHPTKNRIGEGTYGEVYLAVRKSNPSQQVALKRFKKVAFLEGLAVTSVREITLLRHVSAQPKEYVEHCVVLEEVCLSKNFEDVFLVFPFVKHSVSGLQSRDDFTFSEKEIALLFRHLLLALNGVHRATIMHRDIKLNNLLLTEDGSLKLCDFGFAVSTANERAKLTPGTVALDYRPPEMLLGSIYTTAVDIWSAGCCLAQMFLRFPPFYSKVEDGKSEMLKLQVIEKALGPLSDVSAETFREWGKLRGFSAKPPTVSAKSGSEHTTQQLARLGQWCDSMMERLPYVHRREIPQMALDVLERMLRLDPRRRPTAAELLEHPYFSMSPSEELSIRRELSERLKKIKPSHEALIKKEKEDLKSKVRPSATAVEARPSGAALSQRNPATSGPTAGSGASYVVPRGL